MKYFVTLAVAVGILCAVPSDHAGAQSALKIAVLDVVAIRLHSLAGKSIAEQVGDYRKALQKDAEAEQKKLRTAQNELRLQRSLLSPEAMQARERRFRDDVAAVQRGFQARRKALDTSLIEARKVFENNLTEVLKKLRGERKLDIIFNKRTAVIYAEASVDITKEVLKRLDVRVKRIPVKKPGK